MYIDELYFVTDTVEIVYRLTFNAILKKVSINLRKFISNLIFFFLIWRENGTSNNPSERAMLLGLEWDTDKHILKKDTFKLQSISTNPSFFKLK